MLANQETIDDFVNFARQKMCCEREQFTFDELYAAWRQAHPDQSPKREIESNFETINRWLEQIDPQGTAQSCERAMKGLRNELLKDSSKSGSAAN